MMRRSGVKKLTAFCWILAVILTRQSCCVSATISVIRDVGRALHRLESIPRPFALGPGIRVEPRTRHSSSPADAHAAATTTAAPVADEANTSSSRRRRDVTVVDTANNLFVDHDLLWEIAPGLDMRIFSIKDGFSAQAKPSNYSGSGRTFGIMRRMKLVLLPIMYKLGVITTLLTLLTVFALKGLTIGVLLLIMGSVGLATKFKHYEPAWHSVPPQLPSSSKEVHVHVHGGGAAAPPPYHHHHHADYSDPWSRLGSTSLESVAAKPPTGPWNRVGESLWKDSPTSTDSPWDQFIT